MPFDLQPVLKGELLQLRPLRAEDFDALFAVAADPLVWEQHPASDRYQEPQFRTFFREALASGGALIAIDRDDGRVRSRSAGRSWRGPIGGGRYNGEMKRLMLEHAFRFVERVVFLVGVENRRSQRAVEKIGGVRVGSRPDASGNDSIIYEIRAAGFGV